MIDWSSLPQFAVLGWWAALGRVCWPGSLGLLLVAGTCWLLRGLSPSVRSWLWRAAYLRLLVALLASAPLVLAILPANEPSNAARLASSGKVSANIPDTEPAVNEAESPTESRQGRSDWRRYTLPPIPRWMVSALMICWLAGSALSLAGLIRRAREVSRLRRSAIPLEEAAVWDDCANLAKKLRIQRMPQLLVSPAALTPLLLGPISPAIVLPERLLNECTADEVRVILAHELAHLRRGDLWWGWLPILSRPLFFFHPLIWLAEREWRDAQEMACDELALQAAGASIADYGGTLMKLAEWCAPQRGANLPALAVVGSFRALQQRLLALQRTPRRRPAAWTWTGAILIGAAFVGLFPCRLAARPTTPQSAAPLAAPSSAPRIDINAKELPLRTAIGHVLQGTGFECTVAPDVPDVLVTLNLRNVSREQALRTVVSIARSQCGDLRLTRDDNRYHLALREDGANPSQENTLLKLSRNRNSRSLGDQPRLVTLALHEAPLRTVIENICNSAGEQFVIAGVVPDVPVTLTLRDATVDKALRAVIKSAVLQAPGLTLKRSDDIYFVTLDRKRAERSKEAAPAEAAPQIQVLSTTGSGSDRRVSIKLSRAPLHQAIAAIFAGSGIGYSVEAGVLDVPVTLNIHDLDVESAVKGVVAVAAQQAPGLTLERSGANYVIHR